MMQIWVSIDDMVYRPLSIPMMLHPQATENGRSISTNRPQDNHHRGSEPRPNAAAAAASLPPHAFLRFHELAGMTIDIDDNSLRYSLEEKHLCLNALVSNTYLLYLFNPTRFRPLDWTYEAHLCIGTLHIMYRYVSMMSCVHSFDDIKYIDIHTYIRQGAATRLSIASCDRYDDLIL
jgi:hypothetical protein